MSFRSPLGTPHGMDAYIQVAQANLDSLARCLVTSRSLNRAMLTDLQLCVRMFSAQVSADLAGIQ